MYNSNRKEILKKIKDLPAFSVGAPCPVVYSSEHSLYVTYYLNFDESESDESSVKIIDSHTTSEPSIIVKFDHAYAHFFGPPNDEALHGHPLYNAGLEPYSYFEVLNSSWIDKHEKMNRVHHHHDKESYKEYRHFIFTFHDSTLEVISEGYSFELTNLSMLQNIEKIISKETNHHYTQSS